MSAILHHVTVDIYCRAEDPRSLDTQEAICRRFAKEAGLSIAKVYREASGEGLDRRELTDLRLRYDVIKGVTVSTRERLARNASDLQYLEQEMRDHDVILYVVQENI